LSHRNWVLAGDPGPRRPETAGEAGQGADLEAPDEDTVDPVLGQAAKPELDSVRVALHLDVALGQEAYTLDLGNLVLKDEDLVRLKEVEKDLFASTGREAPAAGKKRSTGICRCFLRIFPTTPRFPGPFLPGALQSGRRAWGRHQEPGCRPGQHN